MNARDWKWLSAVALLLFLLTLAVPKGVTALKCYKCNNCIKYELSQSQSCDPEHTHCMKMFMETGTIQRSCGTEEMCRNSEETMKTRYTKVDCCTEDNCNASTSVSPTSLLVFLLVIPAIAAVIGPAATQILPSINLC